MSGILDKILSGALLNSDYELEKWFKPKTDETGANDQRLSAVSKELTEAYSAIKIRGSNSPVSPNSWLRNLTYRFISHYLNWDALDVLERRANLRRKVARGRIGDPNPFQIGLSAIFAAEPELLSASSKERMGKEMWFAYRHFIQPKDLRKFLSEISLASIPHFLKQQYVFPRMRRTVIKNLATRQCHPVLLASYQPEILEKADAKFAKTNADAVKKISTVVERG